jgi:hypothetical protein
MPNNSSNPFSLLAGKDRIHILKIHQRALPMPLPKGRKKYTYSGDIQAHPT